MRIDTFKIEKILRNLAHKDPSLFRAVQKKIIQIAACEPAEVEHFKNLRYDLSHLKRVQVGSFVLVFRVKDDAIIFEDFDHHDRIYKKRF